MPEQPQPAQRSFGERLRHMRKDAGLTGLALQAETNINNARISRIEHGKSRPTEDEIRKWAIACGAARLIPELIAVQREVEHMWLEWRREKRKGQVHIQARSTPLYESTTLLRAYESKLVPGILQTFKYASAVLRINARIRDLPLEDVDEAARARVSRQHLVTAGTGKNSYVFLIEATVFRHLYGDVDTMNEQLDLVIAASRRPNVVIGVIPLNVPRTLWAGESFYIFDEGLVRSGYWAGMYRSRRPDDITPVPEDLRGTP